MNDQLRILHLEDSSDDAELVRATLARAGIAGEWQRVDTRDDYIAALDRNAYSIILADFNLPSFDGMSALTIAHHKCPEVPFIFVSGAIEEQLAIEALTSGATDYVLKSRLNRLTPVVKRALEETRLRRERREYEQALQQLVNSTSALTGHAFFRTLVRDLAAMLHTQYAFIGLIADKDATRIRTIVLWAGNDYAENFEYALQGTPCENVIGKSECFYPSEVQRLFPQDHLFTEMNLESYHGVPLFRSDGTPLGLLSVLDKQPMEHLVHLRPLVRVIASRAAAELERLEEEQKLQEGQTAVRESERRLATLMGNLRGMAYRCRSDPQWTIEFVSGGCEELTGYAPADFVMNHKLAYTDIIVPEDRQAVWDKIQHAIEAKTYFVLEYRITTAAGAVKWVWEHGCGVYGETGDLIAIEGLISDITDRKRAERELERKAALTALLEALARAANEATTPEAALRACLERICTYGHWALGHAALYAPGQSSGMAQTSFWHGQDQKRYEEVIRLSNEYSFNMRHGGFVGAALSERKPVWVEDLASAAQFGRLAVIAKSGLRAGFVFPVVVGDDIAAVLEFFSGEVRAPDTLLLEAIGSVASQLARLIERGRAKAAHAQLAAIVESSEDAILSIDPDGVIRTWNPGAERMLGYSQSETVGREIGFLIPDDLAHERGSRRASALAGKQVATLETVRLAKDGRRIDVSVSVSPIRDGPGHVTGVAFIYRDISERKQAEAARRESEERFHAAFEQAGMGMGLRDIDPFKPRWIRVNQKLCDILGYTREELLQLTSVDITPPEERDAAIDYNQRLRRGEIKNYSREKRYVRKDGRIIWANLTIATVSGPDGRPTHIISVIQDITESNLAVQALRESEEQFRQLATNIPEVFWIIDGATGAVTYVSPAFEMIWGRTCEEFKANPDVWTDAVHPDDRERMSVDGEVVTRSGKEKDYRIVRPDGTIRWIHDRSFPVMENGRMRRIIGIAEDISDRKENESRLLHLAHYDSLTDLPNRVLFRDRLQQTLAQAQRNDWLIGVLLIGLDRFKNINDTYGNEVGDKVLREASQRIAACTRLGDTTARLGGDEFGIILSNLGANEDASLVAQKIMDSLTRPLQIDGTETYLSASIGITLYPADSKDADALIRDANAAIRRAKELGRNNFQFYKTEMNARAKDKLGLETSLRHALDNNEFLLHYQPKVNLQAGEITGFEALLRWQRPERGMVSPADFVPLLEETGLILPVGDWVLRTACAQARVWRDSGLGPVSIAVNLSVRQFLQRDLDQHLLQIINDAGIEPGLLELEITESFLMHNPEEAASTLLKLKAAGIRISVDDFGTGYSSLSYLSRFPIDSVKIDRSFIRDVTQNPENAAITRAVIGLAHALGMKSVAEGVETETQLGFLSANGCDEIQGYFFSRPVPAAECSRMLEEDRRLTAHIRSQQPERFTVLLVDDEETVLQALELVLRRDGYRILTASSAAAGLDLLATHEVGVVISDERMPDMTGVAFLSRVYRMYPDTIRMLLTGYADMQAIISAINDGAVYKFLQKPWDNNALRASVREAFRLYQLINQPGEIDQGAVSDRVIG